MRRGSVQTHVIDDQMPVVADLNPFTTQPDKPFNIKLILRQSVYAFGFENDDLAAVGRAEIVCETIHKQMIAADDAHANHLFALMISPSGRQAGPLLERQPAEIRREENPVSFAADFELLVNIENKNLEGRLYWSEISIHFGLHIDIRNALKPLANASQEIGRAHV